MKVKLYKVESTHNNVRTNETEGVAPAMPEVGKTFLLYAEPLTPGATVRYIHTTTIQSVEELSNKLIEFKTRNSTYRVEKLDESDSEGASREGD